MTKVAKEQRRNCATYKRNTSSFISALTSFLEQSHHAFRGSSPASMDVPFAYSCYISAVKASNFTPAFCFRLYSPYGRLAAYFPSPTLGITIYSAKPKCRSTVKVRVVIMRRVSNRKFGCPEIKSSKTRKYTCSSSHPWLALSALTPMPRHHRLTGVRNGILFGIRLAVLRPSAHSHQREGQGS